MQRLGVGFGPSRPIVVFPKFDDVQLFHEVARALTSNLALEPLLREILGLMERYFGPEQWSLLICDEEKGGEMYYALTSRPDLDELRDLRIAPGEGIAGWVARTGNPLIVPNVKKDPEWAAFASQNPELNLKSIAALPIQHGGRSLGVLMLHNSELELLPDDALNFLRVLCDYTAIALENARQVKLVHKLSITDDCTGLFNSRYMYETLEQEIAVLQDPQIVSIKREFSLVFFDLDHFKSVNDTHGHIVGSRLLAEVGNLVKRTLGPDHSAFRYGGDEFVVLLRGAGKAEATAIIQHLRETLINTDLNTGGEVTLRIKASFGLATFPEDGADLYSIIRASDTMMYKAKADGRNCIAIADPLNPQVFVAPKVSRHSEPTPVEARK
ncbi:diguanylate cyclase [Granulicella cerasi]|uniref:diguanylate cyclase n=1 Tax=Granulicella cerasi TaxID=741063 RepID=A0ABW1ZC94_9BACT|nr:sensor domain-containing diguanylate cyclase [Granulicella cerasi]